MALALPEPTQLPLTADLYLFRGKPTAVIPGRIGVTYRPNPKAVPWSLVIRNGTRISAARFHSLVDELQL